MAYNLIEIDVSDPDPGPSPYRWTADAFYRAMGAGVFDNPGRLELIQGEIVEKMGQNPAHATFLSRLARRLRAGFEPRYLVREEKPLSLSPDSQPVPDILVLRGDEEAYVQSHPGPADAVVVAEVSDTSSAYDLRDKAVLYAQSGVQEYWVVLINAGSILVMTGPARDGFRLLSTLSGDDALVPVLAPDTKFTVRDLFGR